MGSISASGDLRTALVTGVTGKQGAATARHLMKAGWSVRGLTRDARSKAARLMSGSGIELVAGDLEDRARLTELMRGVDGVFAVTPMDPKGYRADRELRQGTALAEAAIEAEIPHLVFSSVSGADGSTGVPHIDVKGDVERRIRQLGVPATVVRPNIFMDNLVLDIAKVYWHLAPKVIGWDKPLAWVAVDDIGAVAAHALGDSGRWLGQTLEVVGDRRSFGEAMTLYREAYGRKPSRVPMPIGLFRKVVGDELVIMWEWQGSEDFGNHSAELAAMPIRFTDLKHFLHRSATGRSTNIGGGVEQRTG